MNVLDFNNALREKELADYLARDNAPDRDKVLSGLTNQCEQFVAWLFPNAIITPRNARVGNIYGSPGTSLVIETKASKRGVWSDFADPSQKGGNLIDLYMAARGLPFSQALTELSDWVGNGTKPEVNYQREQAVRKLKKVDRDLGPQKGEWHYVNAEGNIIATVYRFEPEPGKKEFLPWDAEKRRYGNPDIRPLYNIPGILQASTVVAVEGEKAAQSLIDRGICATCVMGGSNSPLERTDLEPLRGKEVIIWPDADEPGHKFGLHFAQAIADIAGSTRMIEPPTEAPEGWDAADSPDPAAMLGLSVEADQDAMANELIQTVDAFAFDECDIPPRPWVIPGIMLAGYTHMLAAPGGSGKSLFTLQLAIMLATGEPWGEWKARKRKKTLLINVEDDLHEQRRRLSAARRVMEPEQAKLTGMIHLASDPDSIVVARADPNKKTVVATPIVGALRRYIEANDIGVLVVDPFAETFEGDENSNSEVKWAMKIWRDEIAKVTGCVVYLVHHITKGSAGGAGNADVIRGGGAIVNSTRISATLMPMTVEEANAVGVNPADRNMYVRYDDAKANQSLKNGTARWFEKISVRLSNATPDAPADEVGALKPWNPPSGFEGVELEQIKAALQAIQDGMIDGETGELTGVRFTTRLTKSGTDNDRWAGNPVMQAMGVDEATAKRVLRTWSAKGMLEEAKYYDPSQRKERNGVTVNFDKLEAPE